MTTGQSILVMVLSCCHLTATVPFFVPLEVAVFRLLNDVEISVYLFVYCYVYVQQQSELYLLKFFKHCANKRVCF